MPRALVTGSFPSAGSATLPGLLYGLLLTLDQKLDDLASHAAEQAAF
jgi:hypothetical protein